MAAAADSIPSSDRQSVLTVADLNTAVNHEPRIEDLRLGEALGFERPRIIRDLIERHLNALGQIGEVCRTVRQTSTKGGRPGRTYWLNKRQALYLCTKSETPRATETTIQMVEVFDAHLAARAPPPRPDVPPLPAVPFLAGVEPLVSSLAVAQALDRRHTGILRELDVLSAERPGLVGRHVRFATYLHENRRAYRCFHLDRTGFEALMVRLPDSDRRAVALRDATLAGWPDQVAAVDGPAAPAAASSAAEDLPALAPRLDHDGFAVMRIGGEMLVVDLTRAEAGPGRRAVVLGWDAAVLVQDMTEARSHQRFLGARSFTLPDATAKGGKRSVWAVGTIVASQPVATPEKGVKASPRAAKPAKRQGAPIAAMSTRPDLARIEVCGRA